MAARPYLSIDMRDVYEKLREIRQVVGEKNAEKILYWTVKDTAGHIRKTLSPILRKEYQSRAMTIRGSIGQPEMNGAMSCVIPVENARNIIGGKDFPLDGSTTRIVNNNRTRRKKALAAGKKPRPSKLLKQINVKILKKGVSTLPHIMPGAGRSSYGDQPPFLMPVKSKAGATGKYIVMTRKGKEKLPIIRVVGIGVPQMPLNRSREEVKDDIAEYAMKRLVHNYEAVLKKYVK
uniref:Minor tail protein n=1 Tax=Caudovirales sp. ctrNG92 TaxID=2827638 RepID=A0A8S5SEJ3_9CAUD|nr:MAG TPA: minor tail protein [Caudovirales sp. ctrNG92]